MKKIKYKKINSGQKGIGNLKGQSGKKEKRQRKGNLKIKLEEDRKKSQKRKVGILFLYIYKNLLQAESTYVFDCSKVKILPAVTSNFFVKTRNSCFLSNFHIKFCHLTRRKQKSVLWR